MARFVGFWLVIMLPGLALAQGKPEDYERSARLYSLTQGKVFRTNVEPHWFAENTRFWYRNRLSEQTKEFIVVDARAGKRELAFDHAKLAGALAKAAGKEVLAERLPFDTIDIVGDSIHFSAFGKPWAYEPSKNHLRLKEPKTTKQLEQNQAPEPVQNFAPEPKQQNPWTIQVKNFNLVLKNKTDGSETVLTTDGTADDGYAAPEIRWSGDFSRFVALKTKKGEDRKVTLLESSPKDQLQPKVKTLSYAKPGDPLPIRRPHLFDTATRKEIPVSDELFPNPWSMERLHYDADTGEFTFLYNQRGHQVLRFVGINATTGKTRAIINEESKTFLDYAHKQYLYEVPNTAELIWMSERDGWNHLYLYDKKTGKVKNPITQGSWVVRRVVNVDPEARTITFEAGGIYPDQDPYYLHQCRIGFDGKGLVKLTTGDGSHRVRYSPDKSTYLDTFSRVDLAPVTELHRTDDGKLLCNLEHGDMQALIKAGWQIPERFVAKGRDGTTDIYGVIYRPTNFDPKKRYPVIEAIYAGPHGSHVPKEFRPFYFPQELAELGFILVQIDGMGTSNRSKAFHDVCWKNLGDSGFPDRIRWIEAAAAKYPYIDTTRVGIYGGSAGGQSALRALLAHGDFYKAAAADCGCHDNRMDKIWWNELWMGYPIGPHYAEQSNVTQAHKLTGKLLLTVGELDRNVDPASTMQVVNALIKAGKDFELVVFPGADHGAGSSAYGTRRMKDFFVRNLLGVAPPDRNARGN